MKALTWLKAGAALVAVTAMMAVAPVQAQTAGASSSSSSDSSGVSDEDILTISIGCIATYDLLLAKPADDKTAARTEARAAARKVYMAYSGEKDEDVDADIKLADQMLTDDITKNNGNASDYAGLCDSVFIDGMKDADAPASQSGI